MLEPSHNVVKPFKGLKTLKVSVKRILHMPIPICSTIVKMFLKTHLFLYLYLIEVSFQLSHIAVCLKIYAFLKLWNLAFNNWLTSIS